MFLLESTFLWLLLWPCSRQQLKFSANIFFSWKIIGFFLLIAFRFITPFCFMLALPDFTCIRCKNLQFLISYVALSVLPTVCMRNLRQRTRSCEIVWKWFCEERTSFLIFYQGQENTVVNNHQTRRDIRHALTAFKMIEVFSRSLGCGLCQYERDIAKKFCPQMRINNR